MTSSEKYLADIRNGNPISSKEQLMLILTLSWPAILAMMSTNIMELIDAGMVGSLGGHASASIGLVASSTWLINGICSGFIYGFSVQTAQSIGAKQFDHARNLCRQGLVTILTVGITIGLIGLFISPNVPIWLGGEAELIHDASAYLAIFCMTLPFGLLNSWAVQMLQSAGNTKLPGITMMVMCLFDVLFNYLFIFVLNLGVTGAALGTSSATICSSLFLAWQVLFKEPMLKGAFHFHFTKHSIQQAIRIGVPISLEQVVMGSSHVMFTRIVAPAGTVGIAANSFAITVEGLCYMPGYGIASAATSIIGQCVGADRKRLTHDLGWRIVRIGVGAMTCSGVLMFVCAPFFMNLLTPVPEIASLGATILRIEAFAEPMYGASIVVTGILRGKGDTLWPAILNLVSVWCVRIPLAMILFGQYGVVGAWFSMAVELNVRGLLFLWRMKSSWKKLDAAAQS